MPLSGQTRENEPVLEIFPTPIAVMQHDVVGWMRTVDGLWKSENNTIPRRFSRFDDEKYAMPDNALGQDNLIKLEVYDAVHKGERVWVFVKYTRNGDFKYRGRRKGWKKWTDAYFYLVYPNEFLKVQESLTDSIPHILKFDLIYSGHLHKLNKKAVAPEILKHVRYTNNFNRQMVINIQLFRDQDVARFMICSMHKVFPEIEGVVQDFTVKGKSIYGRPMLFDYFYYETSLSNLRQVIPIQ